MNIKINLLKTYEEAVRTPPTESDLNDASEAITTLHQDDWLRILLIRRIDSPEVVTIEVESSLPIRAQGTPPIESNETRGILEGMINSLKYLISLESEGFSLDIIGQDCMWTAYKEFNTPIDPTVFDALTPP
ncbi:MAG: hypothetical protein KAQ65_08315 [Candidatus Thorarchaeota archaeon]|nr:hypothetical protein [Candidatus Thorarchaeota archaeon]MCK5239915.1 hypothetical protein [Candidatus Thorarchaeota archaeon]